MTKKQEWTNEDVAQLLDDAHDLMNSSGAHWLQGMFRSTDRKTKEVSFCSVGAIREAGKGPEKTQLRKAAINELSSQLGNGYGWSETRVIGWNDRSDRTWKEVSAVFRRASKRLRARKTKSAYL